MSLVIQRRFYRGFGAFALSCKTIAMLSLWSMPASQLYRSGVGHYSVQYPADWHLHRDPDVFTIMSFPVERAARGEVLPEGGAIIKILTASQALGEQHTVRELEVWASLGVGRRRVISRQNREIEAVGKRLQIIQVKTLCCGISPSQEAIEWYFQIGGRFFSGMLVYHPGDADIDGFEQVLKGIVLSLALDPK